MQANREGIPCAAKFEHLTDRFNEDETAQEAEEIIDALWHFNQPIRHKFDQLSVAYVFYLHPGLLNTHGLPVTISQKTGWLCSFQQEYCSGLSPNLLFAFLSKLDPDVITCYGIKGYLTNTEHQWTEQWTSLVERLNFPLGIKYGSDDNCLKFKR